MDRRADRLGRGELIVTAGARLGARFLQHPPAKVSARVPLHQLKRLVEVSPANHGAANRADLVNGWQTLPASRTQRALPGRRASGPVLRPSWVRRLVSGIVAERVAGR